MVQHALGGAPGQGVCQEPVTVHTDDDDVGLPFTGQLDDLLVDRAQANLQLHLLARETLGHVLMERLLRGRPVSLEQPVHVGCLRHDQRGQAVLDDEGDSQPSAGEIGQSGRVAQGRRGRFGEVGRYQHTATSSDPGRRHRRATPP